MDLLVSNCAHCAHGIMSDQLSLSFVLMRSAQKAMLLLYICVVKAEVSCRLFKEAGGKHFYNHSTFEYFH